ncbi:MAG: tetratricopeptide repeat protein [Pyrinomonadaceae bacterium]
MLPFPPKVICPLRPRLLLLAAVLIPLLAHTARAQSEAGIDSDPADPGTGGRNTIQGRVYLPSGRRLEKRLRVRLNSVRGGEYSTTTDDNGAFTFRRLAGGTYRVIVDAGKEFETANETVDIFETTRLRRDQPGQTITVQIQLQAKQQEGQKAGVVNAALAVIPKPARDLYERALEAARKGEHRKAVEHLKEAIGLYPEFALAFNELGVQYLKLGQLDRAAESFRAAIKLAPEAFLLRLNHGIVHVQQKKFPEAEGELQGAIKLNETSTAAHLYRGRALIGLNRYDEAEKELLRAVALGGDDASMAHRYLGAIYIERGEHARAITALEEYLRLVPNAKEARQIREIITQLRTQSGAVKK